MISLVLFFRKPGVTYRPLDRDQTAQIAAKIAFISTVHLTAFTVHTTAVTVYMAVFIVYVLFVWQHLLFIWQLRKELLRVRDKRT
jgi:hypothetical protein